MYYIPGVCLFNFATQSAVVAVCSYVTYLLLWPFVFCAGRRQVKKCGVDTHREHVDHEPITVWGKAPVGSSSRTPGQGGKAP